MSFLFFFMLLIIELVTHRFICCLIFTRWGIRFRVRFKWKLDKKIQVGILLFPVRMNLQQKLLASCLCPRWRFIYQYFILADPYAFQALYMCFPILNLDYEIHVHLRNPCMLKRMMNDTYCNCASTFWNLFA